MILIDGDRTITAQLYDDEHEEFTEKKMSIIDYINAYTDEGVTEVDVVEQTRWIPVSERLPEERGVYIVTEKVFSLDDREHKGRYNTMVEQVEYCNGKWQRASFFEVVAWMPLPDPYQTESEG